MRKKKTGLHVWRCLTGWRSAASRVNGSLHTTETFFLWQAGPYITRQRVPLTVVYDRHPTTLSLPKRGELAQASFLDGDGAAAVDWAGPTDLPP